MKHKLAPHAKIGNISIESSLVLREEKVELSFVIQGALDEYIFPLKSQVKRANELWKATCFELFLANETEEAYYELNFSSSKAWNFYHLSKYRAKVEEVELLNEPIIEVNISENKFKIVFEIKLEKFKEFELYNVACILLTKKNERTFWTIRHLRSQPDFHDREAFLEIT